MENTFNGNSSYPGTNSDTEFLNGSGDDQKYFERIYRDYYVMINQNFEVPSIDGKTNLDVSKFVTSVNINMNIDSPPSTCDVTIQAPRHLLNGESANFTDEGNLFFRELDEIRIYVKNRFKYKGEDSYGYSHIFWGVVTSISESTSENSTQIQLSCNDMLWWWEQMRFNYNPSFIYRDSDKNKSKQGVKAILVDKSVYDIIYFLMDNISIADVIFDSEKDLVNVGNEAPDNTGPTDSQQVIIDRWTERFKSMKKFVYLYGMTGVKVSKYDTVSKRSSEFSKKIGKEPVNVNSLKTIKEVTTDPDLLLKIKPNNQIDLNTTMTNDFKSRLEVALETAKVVNYELFQDTDGIIKFKPPLYNMVTTEEQNPIYTIQYEDVRDATFGVDSTNVITDITVQGTLSNEIALGEGISSTAVGTYRDAQLAATYGIKTEQIEVKWSNNFIHMMYWGIGELDRINARRHTASITIEGRPEIRAGVPVFIPWKNAYYYVRGISHNITEQSQTTTLELDSKRSPFLNSGKVYENGSYIIKLNKDTPRFLSPSGGEDSIRLIKSSTDSLKVSKDSQYLRIPASDENGYELIGAFPYGRELSINEKGEYGTISASVSIAGLKSNKISSMQMPTDGIMGSLPSISRQSGHSELFTDKGQSNALASFFDGIVNIGINKIKSKMSGNIINGLNSLFSR